ncbi:hypothetical protein HMPREF1170_02620 [Aeromonas veronii AMC35]|nr:hypothetical protein HMPREF1170_02620 [Aeromonas veronii AMC35]
MELLLTEFEEFLKGLDLTLQEQGIIVRMMEDLRYEASKIR